MPRDDETGWVEPDILINGRALTFAECMAVRVAVSTFRMSLTDPVIREGLGEVAGNYDHHLARVERTMIENQPPTPATAFHAHLDVCAQCRDHPFGLCDTGAELLRAASVTFDDR